MKTAVYAGTFDPPTFGHLDLIRRASRLFGTLIVAIGRNAAKATLFTADEREQILKELTGDLPNVKVEVFDGLLVDFAQDSGATALVRGLRAAGDFEYEFMMALTNRTLAPDLEAVYLMTSAEHMFVSSSIVKEVAALGGDVRKLVPEPVARRLEAARSKEV